MNATSRTLVFAGVAAVSALAAFGAWSLSRPAVVEGYSEVGSAIFPDFKDPLKATALSVSVFDEDSGEAVSFAVKQDDKGRWTIPSHHNYPAEAKERLARTAASLIGLKRNAVQSRSEDDWKNYGVMPPDSESVSVKPEERGTRITLRDSSGNSLVDLIVGKKVKGREKHFYIREPEKKTTYIAEMDVNLSAKFSDWIEPDLLKVSQTEIVRLTVDNYSVDEQRQALVQGDTLPFLKEGLKSAGKWSLEGMDTTAEKLDETAVNEIARNIDQLKIVGVRPKPEGLGADLTVAPEVARNPLIQQMLESEMRRQGFFVATIDGKDKLVSNEGEILAGTESGVKYTLYFGEIARGTTKDLEVGLPQKAEASAETPEGEAAASEPAAAEEPANPEDSKDKDGNGPRRYMLVKVEFDEALLGPAPQAPAEPVMPEILREAAPATEAVPATEAAPAATEEPAAKPTEEAAKPTEEAAKPAEESAAPAEDASGTQPGECGPQEAEPATADEQPTPSEPVQTEPVQTEPVQTEPVQTEPVQTEPVQTEAVQTEAVQTEPVQTEPVQTEPVQEVPAAPVQPPLDPKAEAQRWYDQALAEYQGQKAAYESDMKARGLRIEEGKKKVDQLSRRFASWYYVIEASSFEKFRIQRKDVISARTAEDDQPAGLPGGAPSFPGLPEGLLPNQ